MGWLLQWLFSRIMWLSAQVVFTDTHFSHAQEDVESKSLDPIYSDDYETSFDQYGSGSSNGAAVGVGDGGVRVDQDVPPAVPPPPRAVPPPPPRATPHNRTRARPCTKRTDLYILQPMRLNNSGSFSPLKGKLTNCHSTGCERPFSVQKIPHSNLILLVVDTLCPCGSKQLSITAQELPPPDQCRVPASHGLYRRRPNKCISYHPEEIEIKQCGGCSRLVALLPLTLMTTWLLLQAS